MMSKPEGIRPYGPGKFDTMVDAYVYRVSLSGGCDDEAGSVDEIGMWYGLMRHGHTIFQDHDPFMEPLTEEERELLFSSEGVILSEDSQGFVSVKYFADTAKLDAAWDEIVKRDAVAEAERLIEVDDVAVYDACANVGQIVSNLPYSTLVRIVADFLIDEWGEN